MLFIHDATALTYQADTTVRRSVRCRKPLNQVISTVLAVSFAGVGVVGLRNSPVDSLILLGPALVESSRNCIDELGKVRIAKVRDA